MLPHASYKQVCDNSSDSTIPWSGYGYSPILVISSMLWFHDYSPIYFTDSTIILRSSRFHGYTPILRILPCEKHIINRYYNAILLSFKSTNPEQHSKYHQFFVLKVLMVKPSSYPRHGTSKCTREWQFFRFYGSTVKIWLFSNSYAFIDFMTRLFTVLYFFPLDRHDGKRTPKGVPSLFILRAQPGKRTTIHRGRACRGGLNARPSPQRSHTRHPPPWWIVVFSPGCARSIKQRWRPFRSSRAIMAILLRKKKNSLKQLAVTEERIFASEIFGGGGLIFGRA